MNKRLYEGFLFGLGIFLAFSLIGSVLAVGFHYAGEILPGTFSGDYIFDGDVNITSGNDVCVEGGSCLNSSISSESDPTVLNSVKDGVSWSEISGKPAGFADGVDNTGSISCPGCTCWTTYCAGGTHRLCTPSGWINLDGTNICGGGGG